MIRKCSISARRKKSHKITSDKSEAYKIEGKKTPQESHVHAKNEQKSFFIVVINDNDNDDESATCKAVHSTLSHSLTHSPFPFCDQCSSLFDFF